MIRDGQHFRLLSMTNMKALVAQGNNTEFIDAATSKEKISKIKTGQAASTSSYKNASCDYLHRMQESQIGSPSMSSLRGLPGTQGDRVIRSGASILGLESDSVEKLIVFDGEKQIERAYVFPGQGAQFVGMGADLYEQFPVARRLYDEADEILNFSLSKICFEGPESDLQETKNTQPAIAVTSLALLAVATEIESRLLEPPAFFAGHSLGEYTALIASGALSFSEGIKLVRLRGDLMQEIGASKPGTMAAILGLDINDIEDICREAGAEICNINAPGQVVIGGLKQSVVRALDYAQARGARKVVPLNVGGAFHTSLMMPASEGLTQPIATVSIESPIAPIVANCDARPINEATEIRNELLDQVYKPVQWSKIVNFMDDQGVKTFIEFGPGRVLTGLVKKMVRTASCIAVNDAQSVHFDLD
jgi:[acyl-carrier-protein] S-malonyltransferase